MHAVHYLYGLSKPAWIALSIVGFMLWWPLGIATIVMAIGSRRPRGGRCGRWYNVETGGREGAARWFAARRSSGNVAFDEYRDETLKRLEEQREFRDFLERLRKARDKAEFDQFMDERRARPQGPGPAEEG